VARVIEDVDVCDEFTDVTALKGTNYGAILLNYGEHSYAKVRFDSRSLKNLSSGLWVSISCFKKKNCRKSRTL
jgi:hypothetical protein